MHFKYTIINSKVTISKDKFHAEILHALITSENSSFVIYYSDPELNLRWRDRVWIRIFAWIILWQIWRQVCQAS